MSGTGDSQTVVLTGGCHHAAPLDVTVILHGDDPAIGSLTFERPWTRLSIAMTRDDMERVSHAINEVLEAASVES
jgi:hypothetical protein